MPYTSNTANILLSAACQTSTIFGIAIVVIRASDQSHNKHEGAGRDFEVGSPAWKFMCPIKVLLTSQIKLNRLLHTMVTLSL